MAPQPFLNDSASSARRNHPLGLSPSSLSIGKPSHDAFGQSTSPAQHPSAPVVRIIRIFSPKLFTTDAANFRALVQKLTGNLSGPSDPDGATARNPLKKIRREEKRRKRADAKVSPASRKIIRSTSAGGRSNPTQYNAFASKMFGEGDMNSTDSTSVDTGVSWENSEGDDHLVLPLFPPVTFFGDQCWRLTDADHFVPT